MSRYCQFIFNVFFLYYSCLHVSYGDFITSNTIKLNITLKLLFFCHHSTNGLHLSIRPDDRVLSWDFTIWSCSKIKSDIGKIPLCINCTEKKILRNVGNWSILKIEEHFMLGVCYCFTVMYRHVYRMCVSIPISLPIHLSI